MSSDKPQGAASPFDATTPLPQDGARPGSTLHSYAGGWQPPSVEQMRRMLPQYEFVEMLGAGGMGAVYKARQISLDRLVAIKILPPGIDDGSGLNFAERFKQEAKTMAKMNHPCIVHVHDFGQTIDGQFYFVMEFVEGTDVQKMIRANKKLSPDDALSITAHVCDALDYAHKRGVIHRDIKPANVLISAEGTVKIADFGLAKAVDNKSHELTRSNIAMGTPHFMAPESMMADVKVDARADLYAVGVMLHNMLTGEIPTGRFELPSKKTGCDRRFDKIVDKAMQADRDQRYQKASEIRQDLDTILTTPVVKEGDESVAAVPNKAFMSAQPMKIITDSVLAEKAPVVPANEPPPKKSKQEAPAKKESAKIPPQHAKAASARIPPAENIAPEKKPVAELPTKKEISQPASPGLGKIVAIISVVVIAIIGIFAWSPWNRSGAVPPPQPGSGGETAPLQTKSTAQPPTINPAPAHFSPSTEPWVDALADPGALKITGDAKITAQGLEFGPKESLAAFTRLKGNDYAVRVLVQLSEKTPKPYLYLHSGHDGSRNYVSFDGTNVVKIARYSGKFEDLKKFTVQRTMKDGDVYELEARIIGNEITAKFDGVTLGTVEDDTLREGGASIDNGGPFRAVQYLDLSAPATTSASSAMVNRHRYQVVSESLHWDEAKAKAEAMGGHLATVTSEEEWTAVKKVLSDGQAQGVRREVWLGGEMSADGVWKWVTGEPFVFTAWKAGRPDKTGHHWTSAEFDTAKGIWSIYDFHDAPEKNLADGMRGIIGGFLVEWDGDGKMTPAKATKDAPFVNLLGMRFVPVTIIGGATGGQHVLFSIWETRVQDYEAFTKETKHYRAPTDFAQGPTHPAVSVSWNDTQAFCTWLTDRERTAGKIGANERYRLPSDHEWSCAAGIGNLEDPTQSPEAKTGKIGAFPWGTAWPPPPGAGNYAGEETIGHSIVAPNAGILAGHRDDFLYTAPVGSFAANQFGLFDVGGNADEWCEDLLKADSPYRVLRDASFGNGERPALLSSRRSRAPPDVHSGGYGFRCVLAGDDTASSGQWKNLIPLIDVKRDAKRGEWKIENCALVCAKREPWALCEIPVDYHGGNYDLRVRVTRGDGKPIGIFLPFRKGSAGGDVVFDYFDAGSPLFADGMKRAGFVNHTGGDVGRWNGRLPSRPQWVSRGRTATVLLRVRDDYAAISIDGEEILRWKWTADELSHLGKVGGFEHELFQPASGHPIFGVGIYDCEAVFNSIEMMEVSGDDKAANNASSGGWISLMDKIDPVADAVTGTWTHVTGGLRGVVPAGGLLQLPYEPPEEYDFRIIYTTSQGKCTSVEILAVRGRQFCWFAPFFDRELWMGFDLINGKQVSQSPAAVKVAEFPPRDVRHESLAEVRRDHVTGYFDGKKIVGWNTDYSDMSNDRSTMLHAPNRLGVGIYGSTTTFHDISVREVTGTGKLLR